MKRRKENDSTTCRNALPESAKWTSILIIESVILLNIKILQNEIFKIEKKKNLL